MNGNDHSGEVLDGRYRLVKKLDEGGMGTVYLGEHAVIGRKVAVKLLHAEFAGRVSIVKRFYREAQAATAIKHKNIIDVYDVGETPWGDPYLVMEFLEGTSLGPVLRRMSTLDLPTACGILEQMLHGLEAAHKAGVVHRDLKPENVFLVPTEDGPLVKIIDFGISKFLDEPQLTQLTQEGAILGTPDYMAPEQARGDADIGPAADLYSVGVILYQMLTGSTPHHGNNYNEIIVHILTAPPRPPQEVCPTFPAEALPIVMRALAKDPRERFAGASEMLVALRGLPSYARRRSGLERVVDCGVRLSTATGDLGHTLPLGPTPGMAGQVLSELAQERTPGAWAVTARRSKTAPASPAPVRPIIIVFAIVGISLAAAIAAVGIAWSPWLRDAPTTKEATLPPPPPKGQPHDEHAAKAGVTIAVTGAPANARIYYDNALVPGSSFKVERKETLASVRVEADGFETYVVAVIPDQDRTVAVTLAPAASNAPSSPERKSRSARDRAERTQDGADGSALSETQQRIVYVKGRSRLKTCYDDALRSGAAPRTQVLTVSASLSVSQSGLVRSVHLRGTGAEIPSLARCLEKAMLDWTYPPTKKSSSVQHDFAFTPSE